MPMINRQSPKKITSSQTQISKSKDASDPWGSSDNIRMLLYGTSGTGKTTLAASFPNPLLWLLCSGGDKPGELKSIDTVENRKRITPVIIKSVDHFRETIPRVEIQYKTIVLDHASGFADMVLSEIIGKPVPAQKGWGLATQAQWGQVSANCKECFRQLLGCDCNIVIIAQERTFGGGEDGVGVDNEILKPTVGAALTPSVTGWLNPACDYVCQAFKRPRMSKVAVTVQGKTKETMKRGKGIDFCLRVEPSDVYITKFRIPGGLPEDVSCIVNPTHAKIVRLIKTGKIDEE